MAKRFTVTRYSEGGVELNTWWAFWIEIPNPARTAPLTSAAQRRQLPPTICVLKSRLHDALPHWPLNRKPPRNHWRAYPYDSALLQSA